MNKFLSLNSKFNIFNLLGILIIAFGIYNYRDNTSILIPLLFISMLIGQAPLTYKSIIDYKETKRLNSQLKVTAFTFVSLILVLALNFLT